jgi:nitrogen-specific signal transduction histidine kinase
VPVAFACTPIVSNGRVVGSVLAFHDVTQRKRTQAELEASRRRLTQNEKLSALGTLVSGVAHELRTPLTYISNNLFLLQNRLDVAAREDAAFAPYVQDTARFREAAMEGVERISALVKDLRPFANAESGRRVGADLRDVVAQAVELFRVTVRGKVEVAADLASTGSIPVDKGQIQRVLINLLVNGAEAMPHGGVLHVRTRAVEGGAEVTVRDHGTGIAPGVEGRIFDPFFTTKPQGVGTGVGLSFSHGIVEAHGGTIALEPSRRGAHFRLSLPPATESGHVAVPIDAGTGAESAAGGRALIVEDEADVADTLRELLEREGYQVTVAGDGGAALIAIDRGDYDLILSDVRMPGVSGPDLHARLAETKPHLLERMGFVTGDTLGSSMDDFLRGCGRPVLEKPFTKVGVRCLIASILQTKVEA